MTHEHSYDCVEQDELPNGTPVAVCSVTGKRLNAKDLEN